MYRLRRNDVISCEINDVTHFVRNDVMFVLMCPQAHIISEATSLPEVTSFVQKGKHHLKKRLVETSRFFLAPLVGLEPTTCGLTVRRSTD